MKAKNLLWDADMLLWKAFCTMRGEYNVPWKAIFVIRGFMSCETIMFVVEGSICHKRQMCGLEGEYMP